MPFWQVSPVAQTLPHLPQFEPSVFVFVQVVPQSVGFPVVGQAHTPPWHVWADGHLVVHEPQWVLSVFRFVQEGLQKSGLIVVGQAQ